MAKKLILGGALALLVGACAGNIPINAPSITAEPFPKSGPPAYELQVGDQISIKFWGYPELDEDLIIRPDGKISLPFVDEVVAADRTPVELDAELTRRYTGELATPQITVIVRQAMAQQVYVGGMAGGGGGLIPLTPKLTLFQALQVAGGLDPQARVKNLLLIRTFPDGSRMARSMDLRPILSGADPAADILLQAFDVIYAPPTKAVGFGRFIDDYLDPIYNLLPIRVVGTVSLFPPNDPIFD